MAPSASLHVFADAIGMMDPDSAEVVARQELAGHRTARPGRA
jgi:hypothetical protein